MCKHWIRMAVLNPKREDSNKQRSKHRLSRCKPIWINLHWAKSPTMQSFHNNLQITGTNCWICLKQNHSIWNPKPSNRNNLLHKLLLILLRCSNNHLVTYTILTISNHRRQRTIHRNQVFQRTSSNNINSRKYPPRTQVSKKSQKDLGQQVAQNQKTTLLSPF